MLQHNMSNLNDNSDIQCQHTLLLHSIMHSTTSMHTHADPHPHIAKCLGYSNNNNTLKLEAIQQAINPSVHPLK